MTVTTDSRKTGVSDVVLDALDVQAALDAVSQRATTVRVAGTRTLGASITLGNTSAILGENANLTTQAGQTFAPRPLFDFSASAIDGILTDGTSTFRCQKVKLESVTLKGSGSSNAKAGVKFVANATAGNPGLAVLRDVYIEQFQTGIDCANVDDSHNYSDVHIQKALIGIDNINQQATIKHADIWNLKGSAGTTFGMRVKGFENLITECEFEIGDMPSGDTGTDTTGTSLFLDTTSYGNRASQNRFLCPAGTYYQDSGVSNAATDNTFSPGTTTITRFARLGGSAGIYSGNTHNTAGTLGSDGIIINGSNYVVQGNLFRHIQSAVNCIAISGNYNKIVWNIFELCAGCLANVKVSAGATENILVGQFPNGVNDLGTRTVINGISSNAGNPASAGQWLNQAAKAYELGATIEDTTSSPHKFYQADSAGNWILLG
jgi:hypothetical protein